LTLWVAGALQISRSYSEQAAGQSKDQTQQGGGEQTNYYSPPDREATFQQAIKYGWNGYDRSSEHYVEQRGAVHRATSVLPTASVYDKSPVSLHR
jgi:hypothetical protein